MPSLRPDPTCTQCPLSLPVLCASLFFQLARTPGPPVSVPLAFPRPHVLRPKPSASYFPPSNSPHRSSPCLGVDRSAVAPPASPLCVSVNISFSHGPLPISTPSSFPLSHASLLSPCPVHSVAPFSTSGHEQERLCLCLCSTPSPCAETQLRQEPGSVQAPFLAKW